MSKPKQLFLLADHIKLSLLERQRAKSLDLDSDTQDGHLSRSLDQFRSGLASLQQEQVRLEQAGDDGAARSVGEWLAALQKQLDDLTAQFHGLVSPGGEAMLMQANSEELADDMARAASTARSPAASRRPGKSVHFSDSAASPSERLFAPYRDDPGGEGAGGGGVGDSSAGLGDATRAMTNQQLHEYHAQILDEQDAQLDRLGESIGRQRELNMQMGDELDGHVAMLDEVEAAADSYQDRLDGARQALARVARGAGKNKQMTAIVVLIILVLLVAMLK